MPENLENVIPPVVQGAEATNVNPPQEITYEDIKKVLSVPEKGKEIMDKLHEEFNLKIPSHRLKEEADKRRSAEAERDELRTKFTELEGVSNQELQQYKQWYEGVNTFLTSNPDVLEYLQEKVKETAHLSPAAQQQAIPTTVPELEEIKQKLEGIEAKERAENESRQIQEIAQTYATTRNNLFKEYGVPKEWEGVLDRNIRRALLEAGAKDLSGLDYIIQDEWDSIKKVESARLEKLAKEKSFDYVQKKKADASPPPSRGKIDPAQVATTATPTLYKTKEERQIALRKAITETFRPAESSV